MTATKVVEARWLSSNEPIDEEMLRELLSLDMQCSKSIQFVRDAKRSVDFALPPSTMHWSRIWEWPWAIKAVPLEGKTVLNAGGGHSVMTCSLAKRCKKVRVLDLDGDSLLHVRRQSPFNGFNNIGGWEGDLTALPYGLLEFDGHYDAVHCISVLEHIPDWRQAMAEMLRVLKPGGKLVLTCDCEIVMPVDYEGPPETCPRWSLTGMGLELASALVVQLDPANPPMIGLVSGQYYMVLAAILEKSA